MSFYENMDIKTPEPTNNPEHIQTVAVSLSPIVELDETSGSDGEMSENQREPEAMIGIGETEPRSYQEHTNVDSERSYRTRHENGRGDSEHRQCSTHLSQTRLEDLQQQLIKCQEHTKYLQNEYDELFEFTQLEKQIEHEGCVSKEEELLMKNELEKLQEKVKYLIQDNEDLQNTIQSKQDENVELKASLTSCEEIQSVTNKTIHNIGFKLCPLLMGSMEEVLENNPSLHSLFGNNPDCRSEDYSVEDVNSLINLFLKYHKETISKSEELCVENEELKSKNVVFSCKIEDLESSLVILDCEKLRLESQLSTEVSTKTDLLTSLSLVQHQLKEVEASLRTSRVKNYKLEKELCNIFELNDIQVEFNLITKELDSLLSSWDTSNDLNGLVDTLLINKQLITCVNIVMNHDSQTNLLSVLNKLRETLTCYDKERSALNKTVLELKNHIQLLENETSEIKSSVCLLNNQVQDVKNILVKELEAKFDFVVHEKLDLQSKIGELTNENRHLSEALNSVKNQLEENIQLLEVEKCKYREVDDSSKCNISFRPRNETAVKNNFKERVEDLDKLREMMAIEITCLDSEESLSSILSHSSCDIFARLMQNIIKKEEEISKSLQNQFKVDLQKAQERAESSKNKRKSQESWIEVLQSENEAMSKELTGVKDKSTSLEKELKKFSFNLNSANTEISTLKSKVLELNTDNDVLVVNNEKLLSLLKSEKESVSCLQISLGKLKEAVTTKEHIVQDSIPNTNKTTPTEKQYFNLNEESFFKFVDKNPKEFTKREDFFNLETPTLINCSNKQTSFCEKLVFCNEKCKQTGVLSKPSWASNAFLKNLENEKILLLELLDQSETEEQLGEHLLSCSENFFILKDILKSFANKIIEIEETKTKKLLVMKTKFADLTELNNMKADITKLYTDVVSDNLIRKNETSQFSQDISGYSYMISVKEELELVKEEFSQISSNSQKLGKSAEKGKYVIEMLRKEINKIKQGSLEKDVVINGLRNALVERESEVKEQEKEINNVISKINTMVVEKAYLENETKKLTDHISRLNDIISVCDTNVPISTSNVSNLIERLSQELKLSVQNKCLVTYFTESLRFFTSQCSLLISYVKDLENEHLFTHKKNARLEEEVNTLKKHLVRTKTHIEEADTFLNRIISNIPYQISSIHQGMAAAEEIFSEYRTLKEKERVRFDEQKANQDKLVHQLKDIRSLEKHNLDLKIQLESYENEIRILRSESRNLRLQFRRKERSRVITNEQESQTDHLCCREFKDQILKLEELAECRSLKITSLELNMTGKIQPYKNKVSELECALFQAKERIRDLRFELTQNKNVTQEIINSYNVKYGESQQ